MEMDFLNEDLINKVLVQTTYTREEAIEWLKVFEGDFIKVIKNYMGINDQKETKKIKSINQEIYKQIRIKLDSSMKDYREKKPENIEHIINNLKESEERHTSNF